MKKVEAFQSNDGLLFATEKEALERDNFLVCANKIVDYALSSYFPKELEHILPEHIGKLILGWEEFKIEQAIKQVDCRTLINT